jgi:arginine deiminase
VTVLEAACVPGVVSIESEIHDLKRVLVHPPGREIARMTQHELHELLFDDILAPGLALLEHSLMVEILAGGGAEIVEMRPLLTDALAKAPAAAREELVLRVCQEAGVGELAPTLVSRSPADLCDTLICGLRWTEVGSGPPSLARLRRELSRDWGMALPPVPNVMFLRDPCMAVGDRVVVGRMATAARSREPLLVAFAIVHSDQLDASGMLFDDRDRHLHSSLRRLEGGDVMVLSNEVLFIGCSERTSAQTIERLCREALFPAFPKLRCIYAVMMPAQRSVMHLDTILTHIDEKLFLGHAPLVAEQGPRALAVARIERDREPLNVEGATVLDVLRSELGADVAFVACGGSDPLQQEREQWTDGANAVCVAPGRVILYARNTYTIAALRDHGFEETALHVVQPPEQRQSLIADGIKRDRTVFSFAGSELSRARGGGRCLTMPLCRGPRSK